MTLQERVPRRERLIVRLTEEEANLLASFADARGLSVSDFVRDAIFRRGARRFVGRRMLSIDAAGTIRQLSAIAADLHRLVVMAETYGTPRDDALTDCLIRVQTAMVEIHR